MTEHDFAQVQSAPTCVGPMAWFGANVTELESPGVEYAPGTKHQMNEK